jgi:gentisate 1,2-dioxygenase
VPKESWQVAQVDENRRDEVVSAEIRRHHLGQSVLRRIRMSEFLARIISQIVYVAPVRERERERKRRECVLLCNASFCSNSNVAFIIATYLSTCLDHKNTISRFKKNRNDTRFLLPVVLLLLRFITIKDSIKMTVSAKDDEPNEAIQTLEKSLTPTPSSQGKKKQKRESSSVPGKVPLVKDDDDGGAGGGADGAKKKNNEGGENTEVQFKRDFFEKQWRKDARIYEYGSAANPDMKPIPVLVHPPDWHERGETRIIPFDIDDFLEIDKQCTSPNLMASFIRICEGENLETTANATSQAFYVIRGSGCTTSEHGTINWDTGDLFVVPVCEQEMLHECVKAEKGGAALYWVHDEPLMDYLGVTPNKRANKFKPTLYKRDDMLAQVEEISHSTTKSNNRLGVLLGNAKCEQTKTLTHVLWSLLNSIPARNVQRPHRHNSVALDLAVAAKPGVYTLMGKEIDDKGDIIDPIRCDWIPGGVFITPPGWWHSHHNESDEVAWVLPMQDAGLYTHQRTLDIRFVDDELELHKQGKIRGSAFAVTNKQYINMVEMGAKVPIPRGKDSTMKRSFSKEHMTDSDGEH